MAYSKAERKRPIKDPGRKSTAEDVMDRTGVSLFTGRRVKASQLSKRVPKLAQPSNEFNRTQRNKLLRGRKKRDF